MTGMTRRELLGTTAAVALLSGIGSAQANARGAALPLQLAPVPLKDVRLTPSLFLDAVNANLRYLLSLEADRLLHNFRAGAGLAPKGAVYGGWESDTIAGHTLGHYLSALALIHTQTGDEEVCQRADYIVDELALCQTKQGDGYVAGYTRKRKDGTIVDGKEIWPEIIADDIRAMDFDLNGCWVPLYNWHKLFSGLFLVAEHCRNPKALEIAVSLAGYIDHVFSALSDDQVQAMLACEHGGINESFAELYARTGNPHWLTLAKRIYHHKVLDPLAARKDELATLHANTQIPKLIGLARIHEVGGGDEYAVAPKFFWEAVTGHHSYVIGGNSDREHFTAPDAIAGYVTEQTCEHCNSYNMLKLTRQVYATGANAAYFDYYERAHLNHVMAAHNPKTGMFTYMTPLMPGAAREFSSPTSDFWCCVGTGMESHAKHGDSIWWEGPGALVVNLFIPSRAHTAFGDVEVETGYPLDGVVKLHVAKVANPHEFLIAMRIPGWAKDWSISLNGAPITAERSLGYVMVRRKWNSGDILALSLPMELRVEPTPDDPNTIAILRGPLVMAADLGPASAPYEDTVAPALVGDDVLSGFLAKATPASYDIVGVGRPGDMTLSPFFANYERRSAVYFRKFTNAEWEKEKVRRAEEKARLADLDVRSVDTMKLGDDAAEKAHELKSAVSYPVVYRMRDGRDARSGGWFEFRMKAADGPLVLLATYWGEEIDKVFDISVDGNIVATQTLNALKPGTFVDVEYLVPESSTLGKETVLVRFEPHDRCRAGPVFGVRLLRAMA